MLVLQANQSESAIAQANTAWQKNKKKTLKEVRISASYPERRFIYAKYNGAYASPDWKL